MDYFSPGFIQYLNLKINAVLTATPKAKAIVYAEMELTVHEAVMFDAMREIGMFNRISSQRGKGGGMFIAK